MKNNNSNSNSLLKNKIIEKLKEIYDPEFPMDVITLGLIRKIDIVDDNKNNFNENQKRVNKLKEKDNKNNHYSNKDKIIKITMTLTTPECPYGPMFLGQIETEINSLDEVKQTIVELSFDPPWTPDMIKDT